MRHLIQTTLTSLTAIAVATVPALAQTGAAPASPAPQRQVTSFDQMFGVTVGSDYYLANYTQTEAWLKKVASQSDRIKVISIGKTAEGREQWMAVVSSPENIRNLEQYRDIAKRLALAKGLTDDQAKALAQQGKAVVWIDAGLHATEVTNAQTHLQIVYDMLTKNDPETLRLLNDDIALFVWANPDGLELVANWYMRPADKLKRQTETIPTLYQKYIGHDDNRDSFASNMPETTNMNRAGYREWFPQILYNEHQTGPEGAVVFIPPFRDPYNFFNEPLVINQTDVVGEMMHARLVAQGKGGSVMRSGAPYSTWFNGGIRTTGYFHNQIGILTEIIGNPTPMKIPLVLHNQLARQDEVMPIAPQDWHFQQSLDYIKEMDRAVLDYASRYRETVLYNRYIMGRNQVQKGSTNSWAITPKLIEAAKQAAAKLPPSADDGRSGPSDAGVAVVGRGDRPIPSQLYDSVLHDAAHRLPRAYVISADAQTDMPTTVKFLNALIKSGIEVERAPASFAVGGKTYPAGSFVVRADQAFRPHVLDMFEPQDHPQDFAYPGGPPLRPYDITGYTLAYQMHVTFDRLIESAPEHFAAIPEVMDTPPPGKVIGEGSAGYVVSHATNNSFTLTNRLLKAKLPVFWFKAPVAADGQQLAPGALWIPASAKAKQIVAASVASLGIDAYAVGTRPAGDAIAIKPVRIGLVDLYGGSMASGWTRWLFDQYEFPYKKVFPQELDRGALKGRYDVLVFQSDVLGRGDGGGGRGQPKPEDIPAENRAMLGKITAEKTYPQVASFAKAGGTVITVGNASPIVAAIGVPVTNALTEVDKEGKRVPLSGNKFYVPGSVLSAQVDNTDPLAYGVPSTVDMFYYNNPTYALPVGNPSVKRVSWFAAGNPLRSGWGWHQELLGGTTGVASATLGKGRVFLLGPEVTQRGQPYATFKFLFNGLLYGPTAH